MSNNVADNYTKDSIVFYDLRTGIRQKISIYLSANSPQELHFKAFAELWLNVVDEYNANKNHIVEGYIIYDTSTRMIKVIDTSRGFPLDDDIIERLITTMHSGGKLNNVNAQNQSYTNSRGSNGAGLCVVNCISPHFKIVSVRENKIKTVICKDGEVVSTNTIPFDKKSLPDELRMIPNFTHGSMVEAIIDPEIYSDMPIDIAMLHKECEWIAYGSAGLKMHLIIDGKETIYYSVNGYRDLLDKVIREKSLKLIFKPSTFYFNEIGSDNSNMMVEIILSFNPTSIDQIYSFVNGYITPENGTHVSGMKAAITMAMNKYMQDNDKIPKKYEKMDVSGSIINDFLIAIVSLTTNRNLVWSSQSKESLKDTLILNFVKSNFYSIFLKWLNENQKEADKLVKIILLEAEAREAAKKAKNKVLGIQDNKSFVSNAISKRLNDCLSKNPEMSEVFIVEGESASIGNARDSNFQAYYLLRGKITNVMNTDDLDSDILLDFINMLGCGFGDKKNISKLRYHKIIILTDADKDGQHICALILGFMYKYYPELILNGNVYLGNPPLLKVTTKSNKTFYIKDENHLKQVLVAMMSHKFDLYSELSNSKVPENYFKDFLHGIKEYKLMIDNYCRQLNVTPDILETVILNYKDITKGRFKSLTDKHYKVNFVKDDKNQTIISIDEDVHHYRLTFDYNFYNEIYVNIFNKIANDIKFYNVYLKLKDVKDGFEFHGSLYEISSLMNSLLEGKNIKEARFYKGLGEMSREDLYVSCINPQSRLLTRITMHDLESADKIIKTFLGKDFPEEKKKYLETKM